MAQTEAVDFLRAALAEGERTASDVLREAAALGIAEITLRRARKALGVQVRREGFSKDGEVQWCSDMAMFVTFEHHSGGTFAVSVDHVVRVEQAPEGSTIHLSDGAEVEIKEVFPEVLEKLGWKDDR